jgi:hypothetical protein
MLKAIGAIVVAIIFTVGALRALDFFRKKAESNEEKKD